MHAALHHLCDVARSVRTCAQLRHRSQIDFLQRREPVEADKEEALVEVRYRLSGSRNKTFLRNGRTLGYVPKMFPPNLQEVGTRVC